MKANTLIKHTNPRQVALCSNTSLPVPRAVLGLALAFLGQATMAQTWQTVDDFQYVSGHAAENYGLCVTPGGTLLASGFGNDSANLGHALIMASSDGGNTLSVPLDDLVYQGTTRSSYVGGIVPDASGNLYAAGCAGIEIPSFASRWLVRRSADNGLTWQTVDDFSLGGSTIPYAIAADAAASIYVVGLVSTSTGSYGIVRKGANGTSWSTVDNFGSNSGSAGYGVFVHPTAGVFVVGNSIFTSGKYSYNGWTVRRSLDSGVTWNTVDTFQLGNTSVARGIGMDAQGNLYGVGNAFQKYRSWTYNHWIVRKSASGSAGTWTTVDDFQLNSTADSVAYRFVADSHANLFVAGLGATTHGGSTHWLVRKNPGGVGAWATVDDFQYVSGADSQPRAIAADSVGNVFVGGFGNDASGTPHWLVRRF